MKELEYKGKPTDGQIVQYDAETKKWYPVDPDTSGASGLPLSDPAGYIDTTTYDNPIGSGKIAVAVFPADTAVSAYAIEGDAFPRFVLAADPGGLGAMFFGAGTEDPVSEGAYIAAYDGALYLAGYGGKPVIIISPSFGGSVPATTPGNVIRRVAVFDGDGVAVGFIPIYDHISA